LLAQGRVQEVVVFPDMERLGSVGLLCCLEDEADVEQLKEAVILLKEKGLNINVLAFAEGKVLSKRGILKRDGLMEAFNLQSASGENGNFRLFILNKKDVDWAGVPKQEAISDFVGKRYDLLIVPDNTGCFTLEYLVSRVEASFKVGMVERSEHLFNMILSQSESDFTMAQYLQQLFDYLCSMNFKGVKSNVPFYTQF